ncbi:alternative ribosome rescue aminoacyl-tRNA hydrolase ArfB [Pelagibacterium lentulum]|uniref:Aminoacyl-tRNA hydrolase n=1 Tax=Pelagibacterium lentulum TaxID=2029865 RepID=A0A916RJK7_9HYPH|nr:alternative ribosome rescue aminoacyl-tRNA hydrolase ArfB [Pelagibacterium lentulum]GGA59783.1 aminoacyl-tRNA hydrolase [Pelagibacterium lentulum]
MAASIPITPNLSIPEDALDFAFVRSSGPGGQNVNKVASAVQLRFDIKNAETLPEGVKMRAMAAAGARLTKDGTIVIIADRHRTQTLNRQDAVERLVALLERAATPPKRRRATRPTLASKKRRLDSKARRSTVKSLRGKKPTVE